MHARAASSSCSAAVATQQSARQAVLLLLVLSMNARKAVVGAYDAAAALAAKPTSKPRIEIRVQDFSFSEGPTERPVIEIEAKDMKGSEIYDAILAMAFDNSLKDTNQENEQEPDETLSRQDALLLVFFVLCVANVVYFGASSFWRFVKRCFGFSPKSIPAFEVVVSSGSEQDDVFSDTEGFQAHKPYKNNSRNSDLNRNDESVSELFVRQNALIRLCHLQFLVLAEKLKQELSGDGSGSDSTTDDVSQLIASLPVSQLDKETVRLSDIMQVLEQIPLKEHGISNERIESQMAAIQQDMSENNLEITGAWTRLQELYKSFQAIQQLIQTRKQVRTRRASRAVSLDSTQQRQRERAPYAEEVLGELQRKILKLPVGFTADMFASLGQAIQLQTIPNHRIPSVTRSPSESVEEEGGEYKPKQD